MNTTNFQNLIQKVTGRDFSIHTEDAEIIGGKEYAVYRVLPVTGRKVGFVWKSSKTVEKFLSSFITAFTTKYREPNPASYNYSYGGRLYNWDEKTEQEKEYAYMNHASHMYSKADLLAQIEANFNKPGIEAALTKYGFYVTEYGIGIYCFINTPFTRNAIDKMKNFLTAEAIPYKNEFSEKLWVLRFKLSLTKDTHLQILKSFHHNTQ